MRLFWMFAVISLINIVAYPQSETWKDLKPLASTKSQADRLGVAVKVSGNGAKLRYRLSEMSVVIEIETKSFCSEPNAEWNVPKDTIINLTINFTSPKNINEFGFDVSDFTEHRLDNDLPGIFYMSNKEKGILLDVEERGENKQLLVRVLRFEPSENQNGLRCNKDQI